MTKLDSALSYSAMLRSHRTILLLAAIGSLFLWSRPLRAQDQPPPKAAEIATRIAGLETASASGADELRQQTITIYQDALRLAKQLEISASKAGEYQRQIDAAPGEIDQLEKQLATAAGDLELPEQTGPQSLEQLTGTLETLKSKLAAVRSTVDQQIKEEALRRERNANLPQIIAGAKNDLDALEIPTPPLASASQPELAGYQRQLVRRALLEQQLATLQSEQDYYNASANLFATSTAANRKQLATLEKSTAAGQKRVDQSRLASTSAAAERAKQDLKLFESDPTAKAVAAENAYLAKQHGGPEGLSQQMARASTDLASLTEQFKRISKQHRAAKTRVELLEDAKLTIDPTTGQLLRQQRQKLPDQRHLRERLRTTVQQSAQAQIDSITLEERLAELVNAPQAPIPVSGKMQQLLDARAGHLKALIDDSRTYVGTLSSTTILLQDIYKETRDFSKFVDERLLWIPSTKAIGLTELKTESHAVREIVTRGRIQSIPADIKKVPLLWTAAGIAVFLLLLRRQRYAKGLVTAGEIAQKRNCTSYQPTARAFIFSILLTAPFPLIAWFLYARSGDTTPGINEALRNVAGFLTFTIFFKVVTHPRGLMVDHFRISPERVALIRRHLRWFIPLMAPYVFFATALPIDATASSAGRLFFIGALIVLFAIFFALLRPSKRLIYWRGKAPNHLARVCFALGICAPLALIIGAAAGYFASVQELRLQSLISVWLVLCALLIAAMLYRWILVSRRRLAVQKALDRRAAAVARTEKTSTKKNTKPQHIASPEEVKTEALSVVEVEEQTSRLVRATTIALIAFGIWGIWMPTVPALSALDKVTLWEESEQAAIPEGIASANPLGETTSVDTKDDRTPLGSPTTRVTLQDLAASIIMLILTFVAARNIPGLLELTVFRRMHLQPGSSFAFTTTIRYLIMVTGLVIAFAMIGITWGKVQWIAAAITLGIGFGLQEIFANFVAGLIILFERPIRLGDVVTVGDVSGKVTQIRIRATTILQFNRRELIVPNKEFITGTLVNWTLSDSVLRFEIAVGIAYGSDTGKATEILLQIAEDNSKVLDDPPSDVLFDDFGDSALIFQLRAHVGNVDDLIPVRNEIRYAIDKAFREAKIEIAFPQADIHLKSGGEMIGASKA